MIYLTLFLGFAVFNEYLILYSPELIVISGVLLLFYLTKQTIEAFLIEMLEGYRRDIDQDSRLGLNGYLFTINDQIATVRSAIFNNILVQDFFNINEEMITFLMDEHKKSFLIKRLQTFQDALKISYLRQHIIRTKQISKLSEQRISQRSLRAWIKDQMDKQ